jgi:hypothetical protein
MQAIYEARIINRPKRREMDRGWVQRAHDMWSADEDDPEGAFPSFLSLSLQSPPVTKMKLFGGRFMTRQVADFSPLSSWLVVGFVTVRQRMGLKTRRDRPGDWMWTIEAIPAEVRTRSCCLPAPVSVLVR